MPKKSRAERFVEIQKDKKVVATELSALVLFGAFRAKLWQEPSLITKVKPLVVLKYGAKTAGWLNVNGAKTGKLDDMLADPEQDPRNLQELLRLRERLTALGGVASEAVSQIRDYKIGETPWWRRTKGTAIGGRAFMAKTTTPEGEDVEVDYVEVDLAVHFGTDQEVDRLQRVVSELNSPPTDPLQTA